MVNKGKTPKKTKRASLKEMKADLIEEPVQKSKKSDKIQQIMFANVKEFKNTINRSMASQAKNAEKLHVAIAGWPISVLGEVSLFEKYATDINAIQKKTIGHGYDLIRTMTAKADDITDEILGRIEKHSMW